jgi:hypothetical protein
MVYAKLLPLHCPPNNYTLYLLLQTLPYMYWAYIQRRGSILAWIIFLSVYGADTIAIDPADLLTYEFNYWGFKQF